MKTKTPTEIVKTPQQIRNEVEKEIEKKCLEKYRKSFDYFLGKINFNDSFLDAKAISEWNSGFFLNECIDEIIKSILTEYDKAMKEMIDKSLGWINNFDEREANRIRETNYNGKNIKNLIINFREEAKLSLNELLSKIGGVDK